MAPTEDDPVTALLAAARDGLLKYFGLVTPGSYEVEIAGVVRVLQEAEVGATVARLRAIERLAAAGVPARLVQLGGGGFHSLEVRQREVGLQAARVVDWCEGFLAGHRAQGEEHAGDDHLVVLAQGQRVTLADLFTRPSRDDQCRMVLLGLMHGRPGEPTPVDRLLQRIADLPDVEKPPARKTVVDALMFGGYLGSEMAEKLIAAFGLRWSVTAGPGACTTVDGAEPVEALPEMPGLARLRRIFEASQAGWLRYVGDPSPNSARWSRAYALTVGSRPYSVAAGALDAWLDGLAAFHAG